MCNGKYQNSYTQRPRTPKIIKIEKKKYNVIAQIKEKYGMYTTTPYAHNYNSHIRYVGFQLVGVVVVVVLFFFLIFIFGF